MEQQTVITLIGLAVAVLTLMVGFASLMSVFARNIKNDLQGDITTQNTATRVQLGALIQQLRAEHGEFRDDVRANFAALRGSLDTLERRTFDIATGTTAKG